MSTDRNKRTSRLAAPLLVLLAASCCTGNGNSTDDANSMDGAPSQASANPRTGTPSAPTSKVLQTMDAGGYTYVELDVDGQSMWFAGPPTPLAAGDTVLVPSRELPMREFRSDTLDRTFDVVYFVSSIRKTDMPVADPDRTIQEAHEIATQRTESATPSPDIDLTGIPKADGGMTVAEVFALGKEGAGQDIVLRGKVVKYNANILGKNWLHVRDGSGAEGDNDITVTTTDVAAVGDTVLVRGKLAADRDLGMGYRFDLLIEDAAVAVE